MRSFIVDTGPLIAALSRNDNRHAEFSRFFRNNPAQRLIPDTVVAEVSKAIEYRPDIEVRFIQSLLTESYQVVHFTDTRFPQRRSTSYGGVLGSRINHHCHWRHSTRCFA